MWRCMPAAWNQADDEQEETDALVNQVLDEIGINLDDQMVNAPGQKAAVRALGNTLSRVAMRQGLVRRSGQAGVPVSSTLLQHPVPNLCGLHGYLRSGLG